MLLRVRNILVLMVLFLQIHLVGFAQHEQDTCMTKEDIMSIGYEELLELPFEQVINLARCIGMTVDELFDLVITTAGKTQEKVSDIPASVQVIGRKEIESFGYLNIQEILEHIVGLYMIDNYHSAGPSFGMRGFWSENPNSNIIFMVNGVKQTLHLTGSNPFQKIVLPVGAIEKIEIIKGPLSVLYGSGAFFGAINILTIDSAKNETTNNISVSYESHNTKKSSFRFEKQHKEIHYALNAGIEISDGPDILLKDMTSNSRYLSKTYHSTHKKLQYNSKYIECTAFTKSNFFSLSFHESQNEGYILFPSIDNGTESTLYSGDFLFRRKGAISKSLTYDISAKLMLNAQHTVYDNYSADLYNKDELYDNAYELEANLFYQPFDKLNITHGYSWQNIYELNYWQDRPFETNPKYINSQWSINKNSSIAQISSYTQAQYKFSTKFSVVGGIRFEYMPPYSFYIRYAHDTTTTSRLTYVYRYEYYNNVNEHFDIVPRLAALYKLNDKNVIKLLYGEAIKNPSFESLVDAENLGLKIVPERIKTIEINYNSQLSKNIHLSINCYRNYLSELITQAFYFDSIARQSYVNLSNKGNLMSSGIEVNTNYKYHDKLFVEINSSFQKTEYLNKNKKNISREYSPDFQTHVKFSYVVSHHVHFSFAGYYMGEILSGWEEYIGFPEDPDNIYYKTSGRLGQQVPSYFNLRANLSLLNLFHKGLYLQAGAKNILNSQIYYPATTNSNWADRGTLNSGRYFYCKLGIKLNGK